MNEKFTLIDILAIFQKGLSESNEITQNNNYAHNIIDLLTTIISQNKMLIELIKKGDFNA